VDGFGESADAVWADTGFVQDPPVLELGVGAFAGAAWPGVGAVDVFLGLGFVSCPLYGVITWWPASS
jgi:hypothetical protein